MKNIWVWLLLIMAIWLFQSEVIKYKSSQLILFFLIFDVSLLPKEHHQNYWKFLQVNNIYLKTDTILLQYKFYQFQYFITTCLRGRNLSTKVYGNDLVLFNWGWSRLFNKLSLIRSLNLFALEAGILKWSEGNLYNGTTNSACMVTGK